MNETVSVTLLSVTNVDGFLPQPLRIVLLLTVVIDLARPYRLTRVSVEI